VLGARGSWRNCLLPAALITQVDLLWPEYLYLKRRLEELEERKKCIPAMLEG